MTFKLKILQQYQLLVNDKIDIFQDMILDLTQDSLNDVKGSAGDKHETALSMMHIEQEKLNHKLSEYHLQKNILEKIDATQTHTKITLGSLVQTNGMLLFMSTALPKIVVDGKTIIAVSAQSPLGQKLIGNTKGFEFELNNSKFTIENVN